MSEYEVLDEKGKRVDQSETIPQAGLVTGSVEGERGSGGRESNSENHVLKFRSLSPPKGDETGQRESEME